MYSFMSAALVTCFVVSDNFPLDFPINKQSKFLSSHIGIIIRGKYERVISTGESG